VTAGFVGCLRRKVALAGVLLLSGVVQAGWAQAPAAPVAPAASSGPLAPSIQQSPIQAPGLGAANPGAQQQGQGSRPNNRTDTQRNQNNFDPITGRRLTNNNRGEENIDLQSRNGIADTFSEFQQLVAGTVGRYLPVYGEGLFGGPPSTFAPVDDLPVTPDYIIGPGDQIHVQIFGQLNSEATYGVDRTGSIFIPTVGSFHVAGLRFSQLNEFLRAQIGKIYRNFDLNVNMGPLRSIPIFILGQVQRPGSYTVGSLSTLVNALFASGGPNNQGTLRDIQVRRHGQTIVHFDLYDLLQRGDKSKDVALEAGDVIFIPLVGPQVAIAGSVSNPAIYELRGESTLKQLIDLAGGPTSVASTSQARMERIYDHNSRSIVDVNLATADTVALQNGDIVTISPIIDKFKDAVTLRGNVANPGRYVWHPGMRILDLIPNREALITRNYYQRLNALGQHGADYGPQGSGDTTGYLGAKGTVNTSGSLSGTGSTASGSSVGAALTDTATPFGAANDVVLTAPDIDWSYAVIERQSKMDLTTSLIPFAPGKLLIDGDQSQNLELLNGDVVTIFSKSDIRVPTSQQTRFVRLEGEFVASGVYSVLPGETLRQLVARAGGLTGDAYLFASEFTRESTRRIEAQRIAEYADALEAQIASTTARNISTSISTTDAQLSNASATDAQLAVNRLRRVQPTGRIVLSLRPDSRGLESIPDIALEDGDRFIVPRTPTSVTVQGQVYSANAFLFERGKRVKAYLHMAGGPDRLADRKRMFVLRADGSVYSQQYGDVAKANIFPGDTIVVPPTITRGSLFRNIATVVGFSSNLGFTFAELYYLTR
jgi:polysaccharide export outer membrane protein